MLLVNSLTSFLNYSYLYPNLAFAALTIIALLVLSILLFLFQKLKRIVIQNNNAFISKKPEIILTILLSLILFTRYSMTYLNKSQKQFLPDSIYAMDLVGRDWLDGVVKPAYSLLDNKVFDKSIGYGQGLTVIFAFLIKLFRNIDLCGTSNLLACSNMFYKIVFSFVFFGFYY